MHEKSMHEKNKANNSLSSSLRTDRRSSNPMCALLSSHALAIRFPADTDQPECSVSRDTKHCGTAAGAGALPSSFDSSMPFIPFGVSPLSATQTAGGLSDELLHRAGDERRHRADETCTIRGRVSKITTNADLLAGGCRCARPSRESETHHAPLILRLRRTDGRWVSRMK